MRVKNCLLCVGDNHQTATNKSILKRHTHTHRCCCVEVRVTDKEGWEIVNSQLTPSVETYYTVATQHGK